MDINIIYSIVIFFIYFTSIWTYKLEAPKSYINVHVFKRRAKFWEPWELNRRICPPSLCKQNDEGGERYDRPRGTAGSVFYQGDIVLDKHYESYIYHDYKKHHRSKRATLRLKNALWKNGVVPYQFDQNISPISKQAINKAIKHIQQYTCVRFLKKRKKDKNFILYKSEQGCWSNVGMKGGMQLISIGRGCENLGTAVHETLHALGVWHEQARADRNKFVKIVKENISPRYLPDFNVIDRNISSARGYPYDYSSVMHYSQYAFTRNGEITIQVIGVGKERKLKIGQREGLSTIDIGQVRDMYKCNQKEDTKATECPKGWIKNQVSCYKFFAKPKVQFASAQSKCEDLHSDLVSINTVKEHKFLESHSLKKFKSVYIWRTGGKKINDTFVWFRGDNKKGKKMKYTNWDKNQPQKFTTMALVRNKASNKFRWHGVWAGSISQLPDHCYSFICERRAKRKCLVLKFKDSRDYRGTLDHTIDGAYCQKWSSQYPHKHETEPAQANKDDKDGLGDHNYCRNPSKQRRKRPWCYTAKKGKKWQYCDITSCKKKKTKKRKPKNKKEVIRYQVVKNNEKKEKQKKKKEDEYQGVSQRKQRRSNTRETGAGENRGNRNKHVPKRGNKQLPKRGNKQLPKNRNKSIRKTNPNKKQRRNTNKAQKKVTNKQNNSRHFNLNQ